MSWDSLVGRFREANPKTAVKMAVFASQMEAAKSYGIMPSAKEVVEMSETAEKVAKSLMSDYNIKTESWYEAHSAPNTGAPASGTGMPEQSFVSCKSSDNYPVRSAYSSGKSIVSVESWAKESDINEQWWCSPNDDIVCSNKKNNEDDDDFPIISQK